MKHLISALILLLGFSAQAQSLQKYTRGHKMTTAEINAIDTTRADVVYRAYNTDLGIEIINRRDNQGWVPLVTAGGITDAQIAAGFLNIHPNVDLDDTDDFIVRNPETGLAKKNRLLVYNANQEADVTSTVLIANGESLRTYDDTGENYSDFGPSGIKLSSVDGTRNWYIRNKKGYTSSAVDSTSISIYPTDEFIIDKAFYFDYQDQRWEIGGQAIQTGAGGGAGTGNVTKVGTPVDNQIAVWTGDGTVEGGTGLTYNSGTGDFNITGKLLGGSYPSQHGTFLDLARWDSSPSIRFGFQSGANFTVQEENNALWGNNALNFQMRPPTVASATVLESWTSSGLYIGTGQNVPITFYTGRAAKAVLDNSGNFTATSFKVAGQTDASNLQAGDGTLIPVSSLGTTNIDTFNELDAIVADAKLIKEGHNNILNIAVGNNANGSLGNRIILEPNRLSYNYNGSSSRAYFGKGTLNDAGRLYLADNAGGNPDIDLNPEGRSYINRNSDVGRGLSLGTENSTYQFEVGGDVNITGTYRVNGTPISGGGASLTGYHSILEAVDEGTLAYSNQITGSGYRVFTRNSGTGTKKMYLDNLRTSLVNENYIVGVDTETGVLRIQATENATLIGKGKTVGNNAIDVTDFGEVTITERTDGVFKVSGEFTWVTVSTASALLPSSADITELEVWLNAEGQTGADGAAITAITDYSSNAATITPVNMLVNIGAGGEKEFDFRTGTSPRIEINAIAALDFNFNTSFTYIYIPGDEYGIGSVYADGSGDNREVLINPSTSGEGYVYAAIFGTGGFLDTPTPPWVEAGAPSVNQDLVYFFRYNSTTKVFTFTVYQKGNATAYSSALTVTATADNNVSNTKMLIGQEYVNSSYNSYQNPLNGTARVFGMWSKELTTTEMNNIRTELGYD
tara:strand:+ start:39938 stop:42664 length:2727 start_codon:yes stop_codon:yes gene_type:complete